VEEDNLQLIQQQQQRPTTNGGWSYPELYTQSEEEILSPTGDELVSRHQHPSYHFSQSLHQLNHIKEPIQPSHPPPIGGGSFPFHRSSIPSLHHPFPTEESPSEPLEGGFIDHQPRQSFLTQQQPQQQQPIPPTRLHHHPDIVQLHHPHHLHHPQLAFPHHHILPGHPPPFQRTLSLPQEHLETIESSDVCSTTSQTSTSSQQREHLRSLYELRRRSLEIRRELAPLFLTKTFSDDSIMSGLGVSQKESKEERRDKKKTDKPARSRSKSPKVPKNIWSPGSTTTTTSSTEDTTAASPTSRSRRSKKKTVQTYSHSTQTTPTKVPNHSGSSTMVMSCTTTPTPVGGSWHLPSTTPSSSRETVVTTIPAVKSKKQPKKQAQQSEQREQPSQQPETDTKVTKSDEEATEEDLIPRIPYSSPVEEEEDNNNNNNGDNVDIIDPLADRDILSPSSLSEISLGETTTGGKPTGSATEGGPAGYTPPSSPQLRQATEPTSETSREKYWTLPRRGGEGGGDADDEDEEIVLTKTAKSREPPTTKYSTLPSISSSITTGHHNHHIHQRHHPHHPPSSQSGVPMSSSQQQLPLSSRQTSSLRPSSAYSIPSKPSSAPSCGHSTTQPKTQAAAIKYAGIGPVEEGVPLASRPQVREEFASDWYKTMYKRLHTLPRPKGGVRKEDEPIRIRYKARRPREYRFDANYFSDDEATIPRPRHISEYVTGSSSITEREKQMVSVSHISRKIYH